MIKFIDECVGCPPERGCLGNECPNMNIPVLVCDECGCEPDEMYLYDIDGKQICLECLEKHFDKITYENYSQYI